MHDWVLSHTSDTGFQEPHVFLHIPETTKFSIRYNGGI